MKTYTAFQLKLFMALLMVLDHLHYIPNVLPNGWELFFHVITRCVGVWFGYMVVEGFYHTRSRLAYNCRLFFWAGIMFSGNHLLHFLLGGKSPVIENNIFLTLAVGVLLLNGIEACKQTPLFYQKCLYGLAVGILFLAGSLLTEGGLTMLSFILITYFLRGNILWRNLAYVALSGLLLVLSYAPYPTWTETVEMLLYNGDFLFISVLPFLSLYNGQPGPKTVFSKYFFYLFYPAHLWLIALLASLG